MMEERKEGRVRNATQGFLVSLAVLVATAGCSVQVEQILGLQEGSEFQVLTDDGPPSPVLPLTGGSVVELDISIGFFDLLFGRVDGDVDLKELLIAAPGFGLLGIPNLPTGEVCIFPADENPAPGAFDTRIFTGETTFSLNVDTLVEFQNPLQQSRITGGAIPLPFDLSSTQNLSLGELFGLLNGSGQLRLEQSFVNDYAIEFRFFPFDPPLDIVGQATGTVIFETEETFPTSPQVEVCATNLASS